MNLMDSLCESAARDPGRLAIADMRSGASWSYGELVERINQTARDLQGAGLHKGQTVGLHVGSGADYIVFNYAVWKCGGCVVPIPTELVAVEKQEICRQIPMDFVISQPPDPKFLAPLVRGAGVVLDN